MDIENPLQGSQPESPPPPADPPEAERPSYVPDRFNVWVDESTQRMRLRIREAVVADISQVAGVLRVTPSTASKWITQHGYTVWMVVRNFRTCVACIAARHRLGKTTVLRYAYAPDHPPARTLPSLLQLLSFECPEWPIDWQSSNIDEATRVLLVSLGAIEIDDVFHIQSVLKRS